MTTESVTVEELNAQKDRRKKRVKHMGYATVGLIAFYFFAQWLVTPFQGGLPYGVCKTFLELQVRYPHTLQLSTVDESLKDGMAVRIHYAHIDSFGEYRLDQMDCTFQPDETMGAKLESVFINRLHEVDPEKVAAFNAAIPGLVANPPNLDLPTEIPDTIEHMQINNRLFQTKLF